jgi:hypothetical protein
MLKRRPCASRVAGVSADKAAFLMQNLQVLHHDRNRWIRGISVMQKSDAMPIADVRVWWIQNSGYQLWKQPQSFIQCK